MTEPTDSLLDIEHLSVDFHGRGRAVHAVRDVSLQIKAGETVAVLGESGSGKSVTAMSVMGLLGTSGVTVSGAIRYQGTDLLGMSIKQLRRYRGVKIGMIFQDALAALNPVKTVGSQIAEVVRAHTDCSRGEARQGAIQMMDRVKIPSAASRYADFPHQFSGGMRQRIMIAMALVLGPSLLIADEPTTALDVTVQAQIMQLLADLQSENGMALLLITHDIAASADLADRIVVMYAGRIVEAAPVGEIYAQPKHPYTVGLLNSIPRTTHKGKDLTPISGSPPPLTEIHPGCSFTPRCPMSIDRCLIELPALREVSARRLSACHRAEEVHGARV